MSSCQPHTPDSLLNTLVTYKPKPHIKPKGITLTKRLQQPLIINHKRILE